MKNHNFKKQPDYRKRMNNSKYGHVGVVTGYRKLNSPCHDAKPKEIILAPDESGFNPVKDVCSVCGKEYSAVELDIV